MVRSCILISFRFVSPRRHWVTTYYGGHPEMLGEPIATLRLLHYEGLMSSRPEIGNKSKTQNNAENEGFAESQGNEVIPAGLKRFRDEDVKPFSGLNAPESQVEYHWTKRPTTFFFCFGSSIEFAKHFCRMTAIEKFLQLSDFVPSKIRAKRGCATHPRSIAEKSGGGLVEFAVAKKNILINATLGGVGHYALHRPIVN
ncbi:hypothetical protein JHK82_025058 [Glycine max]|nr:hypothetical protein JHK82_025058 [Glycine max]